jgi:hypothetical protein
VGAEEKLSDRLETGRGPNTRANSHAARSAAFPAVEALRQTCQRRAAIGTACAFGIQQRRLLMALLKRTVIGANADKKSAILYHDSPNGQGIPVEGPVVQADGQTAQP